MEPTSIRLKKVQLSMINILHTVKKSSCKWQWSDTNDNDRSHDRDNMTDIVHPNFIHVTQFTYYIEQFFNGRKVSTYEAVCDFGRFGTECTCVVPSRQSGAVWVKSFLGLGWIFWYLASWNCLTLSSNASLIREPTSCEYKPIRVCIHICNLENKDKPPKVTNFYMELTFN